ncbi:MAG: UDP-2,3-diacylglucosamine diphosphatase [bacterium]|nr:UDP-2,3-diacylglucosamine diphosphatase [bacterium]
MVMTQSGQNVFFADLHHPGGENEEIDALFDELPSDTSRVFLLGDIFHVWINDPYFIDTLYASFLKRLRSLAHSGVQLFFLEGNRDFLASHYLEEQPWIDVLPNPTVLDLGGRAVYVGHGDELCWNDWAYQLYKTFIRSAPMRLVADKLPSAIKQNAARRMEAASQRIVKGKTQSTLAVPERAYLQVFSAGVDAIVHGHIHNTYQKSIEVQGKNRRIYCFGWKDGKRNMIHFEG